MSRVKQQEDRSLALAKKLSDHADEVRASVKSRVDQMNAELEMVWQGAAGTEFRDGALQMAAVVNSVCDRTQTLSADVTKATHQVSHQDTEHRSTLRNQVAAGLTGV